MNAPWAGGAQTKRDAFAAFVADEPSRAVLCEAAGELGWPSDKCRAGTLRDAVQSLAVSASPSILVVDLSGSADPFAEINTLAEVCEPGTLVVALGEVNDVRLYRDLLASGIHDYLVKPLSAQQVRDVLASAQEVSSGARIPEAPSEDKHHAIAVVGTRGGVGASTVATSLAWLLSTEQRLRTALLDLDVHFGTGALALDLEPGRGLIDAIDNPGRIDGLFIERAMVRANERLSVLSAEAPLNAPLPGDGAVFGRLEQELRQSFEATVIDLPRSMLPAFPQLTDTVDVVVVVAELTLASARDGIRLLSWLKGNASRARTIVVANKLPAGGGEISRADFEASIERKIDFDIPDEPKGAIQAAKLGQTLAEAMRSGKPGQALRAIAAATVERGESAAGPGAGAAKRSLLDRFGDLRALRPARPRK